MLKALIKKELLHNLVSFRFLFCAVIMLLLAALAAVVGTDDYLLRRETHHSHLAQYTQDLEKIHVYSYLQPVVVRAPEPLGVLDRGLEGQLGNEIKIDIFSIPAKATGEYRSNPFMATMRELDLTTLVRVVLGLLALLLTFDTIIGEKERKTLLMVLANSVDRWQVLAAKFLGAWLALLGPLAISVLLSLVILSQRGQVEIAAGQSLRILGLCAAYALYLALMVLLGLALSLFSRNASSSLAAAMLTWLALVFLIPQTATPLGREIADLREQASAKTQQLIAKRDLLLDESWRQDPFLSQPSGHSSPVVETTWNRGVLRRYGSADYYDALARFHEYEVRMGLRYADSMLAAQHQKEQELHRAETLIRWLSYPSPAFLLERVAESFAGTSIADHDEFIAAARAYRAQLIDFLQQRQAFQSWRWFTDDARPTRAWPTLLGLDPEEVDRSNIRQMIRRFSEPDIQQLVQDELSTYRDDPARRLDLDGLPIFSSLPPSLDHAAQRVALEILGLVLITALLATVSLRRFRTYSVVGGS